VILVAIPVIVITKESQQPLDSPNGGWGVHSVVVVVGDVVVMHSRMIE
jgi:hypothetical protein